MWRKILNNKNKKKRWRDVHQNIWSLKFHIEKYKIKVHEKYFVEALWCSNSLQLKYMQEKSFELLSLCSPNLQVLGWVMGSCNIYGGCENWDVNWNWPQGYGNLT